MSATLRLDGRTIDLERPLRVTRRTQPGQPGFVCAGVLAEAPHAESGTGMPLTMHLVFVGGVTADYVPAYGDVLENVDLAAEVTR